jgi:hypothetical protein
MQVPALIYGFYPEVKRRSRRMVTQMKRGATFEEAIGADHLIDSAEHDGLFNLADADRLLGGEPHYHVIYPLSAIGGGIWEGRLPEAIEETVFCACLQSAWGILLLLPHTHSARWVDPQHRWVPFLRAAAQFWPVLEAEGKRYTYVSAFYAKMLANTATTVDYVLGNAGIFRNRPDLMVPPDPLRPPNWPALFEAYAERRARQLH